MHRLMLCLLCTVLLLSGCCWRMPRHYLPPLYPEPDKLESINYPAITDVVFGYGVELKRDKDLILSQSSALFDAKVNKIRLDFVTQDLRDLQQARELLVDVVEGLLKRVNFNMAVAGSLSHRPFTPADLDITMRFESFFGFFVDSNYTGRIDMSRGTVTYSTFNLYNGYRDPWGCKTETYALSRQLVTIDREIRLPYSGECLPEPAAHQPAIERFHCQPVCPTPYRVCNPMEHPPYYKCR